MVLILMAYIMGFSFSVFGAEFSASVRLPCLERYQYQSQEYIDVCTSNGITCSPNTLFVSHLLYDWKAVEPAPEILKKIIHLPLALFLNDDGQNKGDHIISIKGENSKKEECTFKMIFGPNLQLDQRAIEDYFRRNPFSYSYSNDQEKQKMENIKAELIKAGILAFVGKRLVHGPNGYFGLEEYNNIVREYRKEMLFYYLSSLMLGAGFLFGAILYYKNIISNNIK